MENNYENFGSYYEEIPEEKFEKYAIMFGEGSQELTDLLLYCWQNGIKTFACCKGHKETGPGYIGFLPDEELLKYMCEISDQIKINSISLDRYFDFLRVAFYVIEERDFKRIKSLIQKYVEFKKIGYQYNTRFKETDRIVKFIANQNNVSVTIKQGNYQINDISSGRITERGYYCPKSSITYILHSKIMRELDKSFTSENSQEQRSR